MRAVLCKELGKPEDLVIEEIPSPVPKDGEVLLVHGAAGGLGLTAVESGKHLGATVIATASTPAKPEVVAQYGADYLINYEEEEY